MPKYKPIQHNIDWLYKRQEELEMWFKFHSAELDSAEQANIMTAISSLQWAWKSIDAHLNKAKRKLNGS